MRFATWNICSGRSPADGRVDLDRFAEAIATLDADVLSLQEVDRDQPRSHGADLSAIAAEAMGASHRLFAPALYGTPGRRWTRAGEDPVAGPAYGCALVSRVPLRRIEVVRMAAAPVVLPLWVPGMGLVPVREEPRVAIVADLQLGDSLLTVIGTHLAFVPVWKRRQLQRIVDEVAARENPVLLMGDLNLRGTTPARVTGYRSLAQLPTFPAPQPRVQLDHVLLRGRLGTATGRSTPQLSVSDHRPLVVDVDLDAGFVGRPST